MANNILVLSGDDLKQALDMPSCINEVEKAFGAVSKNEVDVPIRTAINMAADNAVSLYMPAYHGGTSRAAVKTVMVNKDNPSKGLPLIHAMVTVFDSATGVPLSIMDGEMVTAMRTGAASGLATKLLSRKDSKIVAIFGSGAQGKTQLEAVCAVRDIKKAYIFDRDLEKAEEFAKKMSEKLNIEAVAATDMADLSQADIICTATSSPTPVFADELLKPGVHINGVGSYKPDMAEIPFETTKRGTLFVDQRAGCLAEAGDLVQGIAAGEFTADIVHGEIGELSLGLVSGRTSDEEITIFKTVGVAAQDVFTAALALNRAKELGLGQTIVL